MTKNAKLFSMIVVVFVLFIMFSSIWLMRKPEPKAVPCEPSPALEQTPCENTSSASSNVSDTNEDWKEYINPKLGFSMWLPRKAVFSNNEFETVNVIEDNINNTVYIGAGIESLTKYGGWAITTKQIKNDSDLEALIKEKFGSDCKLGKKEYLYDYENDPTYNVEAVPGEKGMESNCPLNYQYKVFYSEGLGRAMALAIGQECRFSATLENYGAICYDNLILNSFKFDNFANDNKTEIN